ncbi:MAG: GNAT family N-acetyltransferase [Chloroflexota bacterium]|nr:GNAT family N-acetyltransferase [Chloroflexota bacterium]
MNFSVQRISAEEWQLLRELRLAALRDSPEAFGQRYEAASAQTEDEWRQSARAASRGDARAWFIARDGARAVGLVMGRRRPPDDCLLFSMWVARHARRGGAGRDLVQAIEEWARGWGGRRIVLWVIAGNEEAMRFYERLGFRLLTEGADAESGHVYGAIAMERPIAPVSDRARA